MFLLKFDTLEIPINDYLLDGEWLVIDANLATKEMFNKFSDFHLKHHLTDDNPLNFTLNNVSYQGSLGTYIYDIDYNIRLYISTTQINKPLKRRTAYDVNLPKIMENHEKRLTTLTQILKRNNLLSNDEELSLEPYLPIDNFMFALYRQVPDLNKHLKENHSTLEELRSN